MGLKSKILQFTFCALVIISCSKDESFVSYHPNTNISYSVTGAVKDNFILQIQNTPQLFDINDSIHTIDYPLAEVHEVLNRDALIAHIPLRNQLTNIVDDVIYVTQEAGVIIQISGASGLDRNNMNNRIFEHFYSKQLGDDDAYYGIYNASSQGVPTKGFEDCETYTYLDTTWIFDYSTNTEYGYVYPVSELRCNESEIVYGYIDNFNSGGGENLDVDNDFDDCVEKYGIQLDDEAAARLYFAVCGCDPQTLSYINSALLSDIGSSFATNQDGQNCAADCRSAEYYYIFSSYFANMEIPCNEGITIDDIINEVTSQDTDCHLAMSDITNYIDSTYGGYFIKNLYGTGAVVSDSLQIQINPPINPGDGTNIIYEFGDCNAQEFINELPSEIICSLIGGDGTELINVCDASQSANSMICDLFENNTITSEEEFYDALEANYDYIEIIESPHSDCKQSGLTLSEDCPKLDSILNLLIGDNANDPLCFLLDSLGFSDNIGWRIIWDCDDSHVLPNANASTYSGLHLDERLIPTYFRSSSCDLSCMELLSIVIHEGIHAEIYRVVMDSILSNSPQYDDLKIPYNIYSLTWTALADMNYGGEVDHHILMAERLLEVITIAIWQALGEQGFPEDYLYWAYDGLALDLMWANGDTMITPEAFQALTDDYFQNIEPNINFDCDE